MKKFTDGVRRAIGLTSVCAIVLSGSITSEYAKGGNDDKAKKEEVKLGNTFIENDEKAEELSANFKKIAKIVEFYAPAIITQTTATTSTTSTTVLTTTTVSTTTVPETTIVSETKKEETVEVYDIDTEEYEESDYSESEYIDNSCNDECVEAAENIVQSSGDITDYISESDYILLCNAVGHEYGSDGVPIQEKALVVEVIMNRVNSASYPGTIYDVLTQQYQFSGAWEYVNLGCFSKKVTQSVKDSIAYYFEHPDEFSHGYLSFNGDGYRNYFH